MYSKIRRVASLFRSNIYKVRVKCVCEKSIVNNNLVGVLLELA